MVDARTTTLTPDAIVEEVDSMRRHAQNVLILFFNLIYSSFILLNSSTKKTRKRNAEIASICIITKIVLTVSILSHFEQTIQFVDTTHIVFSSEALLHFN